ncbi:MAG: MobA/MobL family protein [Selenomonadaceae bacterium]|nr:MobA/MobL family protein [Selenomonadaceae bacterium]
MATYHLRVKDDTKTSGKRVSAKRHVDYILREDAKAHADYINRKGVQNNRDDCVYKGSQLPKWAKDSAQKFFEAATRYEDKENVRYREIELSLPNKLTLEQNREIIDTFLKRHLSENYYAHAIHEEAGELSGERHPHVHIIFSERLIDEVKRKNERPAYKYFRRSAKPLKGEKIAFLAANFLFKNLKIFQEYETEKKLVNDLSLNLQVAKKRFYALNNNYSSLKKNHLHRIIQPVSDSPKTTSLNKNELTNIIADASLDESCAVQLVARSFDNNLEMKKN